MTDCPSESFNFDSNSVMLLSYLLSKFDDNTVNFNCNVKKLNTNKKEFNKLYEDIDKNILDKQQEVTLLRGSELLSIKIDRYNKWIKYMYNINRITLVLLCIIIIISLIYKLL